MNKYNGEDYLIIGDLYVSANGCVSFDDIDLFTDDSIDKLFKNNII